jgi:very-short-patch-repair endonuclease
MKTKDKENLITGIKRKLDEVADFENGIQEKILDLVNEELEQLISEAVQCESPIEFDMSHKLKKLIKVFNATYHAKYEVVNQAIVTLPTNEYRVDFLIYPQDENKNTTIPHIIVECDGHEFHERTKDQAQRDKKRDRELQKAGLRVLRFTGSEIFEDPDGCAKEVMEILESLYKQSIKTNS